MSDCCIVSHINNTNLLKRKPFIVNHENWAFDFNDYLDSNDFRKYCMCACLCSWSSFGGRSRKDLRQIQSRLRNDVTSTCHSRLLPMFLVDSCPIERIQSRDSQVAILCNIRGWYSTSATSMFNCPLESMNKTLRILRVIKQKSAVLRIEWGTSWDLSRKQFDMSTSYAGIVWPHHVIAAEANNWTLKVKLQ